MIGATGYTGATGVTGAASGRMTRPRVTPYHPKEMGADGKAPKPMIRSGVLGVLGVLVALWYCLLILVFVSPFVLLGVAEIVMDSPTFWRVRWCRPDIEERGQ